MRTLQRGSTMIEALVALAVFAVGVLGVIAALTSQAKSGQDARYRTEAAVAADELVARIRTSSRLSMVADFQTGGGAFNDWLNNRLKAPGTGLPGADASVDFGVIGGDDRTLRIEVRWTPPREAVGNAAGARTATTVTHRYRTVVAIVQ